MARLFESVTDLAAGVATLRRRRWGVVETRGGRLDRIVLRPWPKLISAPGVLCWGGFYHRHRQGDFCRLYYGQPLRFPNFLVINYMVSARDTSYRTFLRAIQTLDELARLKGSDALLCELTTWRITPRMMARWGWEPHCPSRWRRHYIKRFYGRYPAQPAWLAAR